MKPRQASPRSVRRRLTHLFAGLVATLSLASHSLGQATADFVRETTALPVGRHFHGSAVLGNYLYVFGGADAEQDAVLKTHVAALDASGAVEVWRETTPLPGPRMYLANATLVLNDTVYLVGGSSAPLKGDLFNTVLSARPGPDGQLGAWRESPPFGEPAGKVAAVSTPGHIHAIGGLADSAAKGESEARRNRVLSTVWSSAVLPDGSLGPWTAGPSLPVGLWYHSAAAAGGRVYVWGGLKRASTVPENISAEVYSAPILLDGRLGDWRREVQSLPRPFYNAPSGVVGPYLLSIAPRYGAEETTSDIWWTAVGGIGLAPWRTTTSATLTNRLFHPAAWDYRRGIIYIPGGRATKEDRTPSARTYALILSPEARRAGEESWERSEDQHTRSVSASISDNVGGATGAAALSYLSENSLPPEAPPGFQAPGVLTSGAATSDKPIVLYFRHPGSRPTADQEAMLRSPEFTALARDHAFAWVDVEALPQLAQQHGVFRVPTWLFFDARRGLPLRRHTGVLSTAELTRALASTYGAASPVGP